MIGSESLKGKIRNIANSKNLRPQEVLQMFFFERFLERLSKSEYKFNFVIKGGLLISSMIGIDNRTTMDMDTTIKGLPLKEEAIRNIISKVINVKADDNVEFEITDVSRIREEDEYKNFRVHLIAKFDKIKNDMKIDITTGDAITPKEIDLDILKQAIISTAKRRDSLSLIKQAKDVVKDIKEDTYLKELWKAYLADNLYVDNLNFLETVKIVEIIEETIALDDNDLIVKGL